MKLAIPLLVPALSFVILASSGGAADRPQEQGNGVTAASEAGAGAPRNPWKPAPLEVPEEVALARVLARTVVKGGGGPGGGDLVIQRIEPPVFPVRPPLATAGAETGKTETLPAPWKMAGTMELRLFSPTVILYPDGISLVRWGEVDRIRGWQQFAAWVRLDLSSLYACGDVMAGKRRYSLMPVIFPATDRMARQWKAPSAAEFSHSGQMILAEGDPAQGSALEPLQALLDKYDREGPAIEHRAQAIRQDRAARAAWETAHPAPPENTVVRFWTIGD